MQNISNFLSKLCLTNFILTFQWFGNKWTTVWRTNLFIYEIGTSMAWRKKNVQHVYVILANFFCILNPLLLKTDSFFFTAGKQSIKKDAKLELVSKELNDFGVIAGLFQQIGGRSSRFVLFCSFWRLFTIKMIKSVKVFPFSFWKIITIFFSSLKFKPPA